MNLNLMVDDPDFMPFDDLRTATKLGGKPALNWYLLRVPSGREFTFERWLREDGYENLCVPIVHRLPKDRAKKLSPVPKYLGLVFIGFDIGTVPPWGELFGLKRREVHRIKGGRIVGMDWKVIAAPYCRLMRAVVDIEGRPAIVPDREMRRILLGSQRIEKIWLPSRRRGRRKHGFPVAEIISGPYAGRTVRISQIDFETREVGLLQKPIDGNESLA